MNKWKCTIPWKEINELSNLTNLIYRIDFNMYTHNKKWCQNIDMYNKLLLKLQENLPNGIIIKFFTNSEDLQCIFGKIPNKKKYIIVFRGSESIKDWINNIKFFKKRLIKNIKVHSGFLNQLICDDTFKKMKECVRENIQKNPDWEWYVTGHSLGAGLSVLTGYFMSKIFKNTLWTVLSLASPRIGNKDFKSDIEKISNLRHFRICNNRDIITAMPMWGYYHTGYNILYNPKKSVCDEKGYNPNVSYSIKRCWNIRDHYCTRYVNNLNKGINNRKKNISI